MERLPVEIISDIFSYLDRKNFLKVSEVCRNFFEIINTKYFMRKIAIHLKDFDLTRNYINSIMDNIDDDFLVKFNMKFYESEKLTSVNQLIVSDTKINQLDFLISTLNNKFQYIHELRLEGVYMNELNLTKPLLKVKLPNLKVIKFFYCTNELLSMFTNLINQLRVFKLCLIQHNDLLPRAGESHDTVFKILRNNCQSLDKLNLFEINFDDSFLEKMSTQSLSLRSFSMSFCYQSSASFFLPTIGFEKFICSQASTLEKFKIRTFDHINQTHLNILTNQAVNLKHLNIIICPHCEWNELILTKLKKLEKLKIESKNFCSRGGATLNKFMERFMSHQFLTVKYLSVTGEFCINDEIVSLIIKSLPNLKILKLQYALDLQSKHVYLLRDKLKFLKKIELNFCEFLDNRKTFLCVMKN